MKRSNVCEVCNKRYRLPVGTEGMEMREYICFNCEFCLDFLDATIKMLKEQRDFKFGNEGYKKYKELKKSI